LKASRRSSKLWKNRGTSSLLFPASGLSGVSTYVYNGVL
jgi:hypothetical protein